MAPNAGSVVRADPRGWGGLLLFGLLSLFGLGCDQTVTEGHPDAWVLDARASDQAAGDRENGEATDRAVAEAGSSDGTLGPTVQVRYLGQTTVVALLKASPVQFEGTAHARLSDVITLAAVGKAQSGLQADFESSDGFRSSTKSTCNGLVPVKGDLFPKGYVDQADRKLRWDTALGYPGCLYVKTLAVIHLTDR